MYNVRCCWDARSVSCPVKRSRRHERQSERKRQKERLRSVSVDHVTPLSWTNTHTVTEANAFVRTLIDTMNFQAPYCNLNHFRLQIALSLSLSLSPKHIHRLETGRPDLKLNIRSERLCTVN